ncbi:MAG: 23S rRNA (guanosine(2251)-2'-O)-methyltransferase RlmB [Tannerellaceae bacterium]|jgi:23S rRNA (guanosine2251-2'-O)-methyltransferase|nr:23S rRNA (guanosine(2251)-2'-O)-methyltransferase RlmB [Tannerellaceae bacterium]
MKDSSMIFGLHAVMEAIRSDREIDTIYIRRELQSDLAKELLAAVQDRNIVVRRVPVERLNRITSKNHQGVIAYLQVVPYQRLEDILPFVYEEGRSPFVVMLDGVTDVRNFGAIARSCECAGVDALVIPARGSAAISADAVKTSAGALLSLPVCREAGIAEAIRMLHDHGVMVVAASEGASELHTSLDLGHSPVALLLGSEDEGIAAAHLRMADRRVRIPVYGSIQSLNVSVAASVLMYEVVRQRKLMK